MPIVEGSGDAGDTAIEEIRTKAAGWFDDITGDVGRGPATKQIVIGSLSGWCTGYLSMKVGKVAAIALGGGIILLQVANHKGYVHINWNKVYSDAEKVGNKIQKEVEGKAPSWLDKVDKVREFARENSYATVGFVGGFLIGMASS